MRLTSSLLAGLTGVEHAFFTREGGVSAGLYGSLNGGIGSRDDRLAVHENRARMARALGVAPERFATPYQVHSPDVAVVEAVWPEDERPKCDAVVTRVPGIAIGVSTADCGPLLFADAKAGVIGAAHAGWKGAFSGVAEATIAAMEGLGAHRGDIVVAIGPMIRQRNYEVGADFVDRFVAQDTAHAAFFVPSDRASHALFDLPGYLTLRLSRAGIGQIDDLGHCTYADPARFYSYRRSTHRGEPDYGRHISAITIPA
jgi:YfiH family protein